LIERYTLPQMGRLWSLENKFKKWLDVEIYACVAWAELGVIPREAVELIRENATFTVDRILELEASTRHDVVAFTRCVAESLGEESKYVHYGLTSSDVVDTALSLLLVEAVDIIMEDVKELLDALAKQAKKYKFTMMMGRTHGVHAEPTTLGLKMALWYAEMQRNLERLKRARETIRVGKLSGAVGTYANIPPFVEEFVCAGLGLKAAPISTQVLQRDRHAEYVSALAITAGTLEKMATEIRGLQKTEVREVEEPFRKGQKGSSAMPHKRNPVTSEQIAGLARILRGNTQAALENMALWHERDISHSSVERVILPDSTILVNYMLKKMTGIISDLLVYPENMKRNMAKTFGLFYSQRVLLSLIDRGLSREEAYDLVQQLAMQAWEAEKDFLILLKEDSRIEKWLSGEELERLFNPAVHLENIDTIFKRLELN
jgi:adenylosuccinate lyase